MLTVTIHALPLNENNCHRGIDLIFPTVEESPNGVSSIRVQSKLGSHELTALKLKSDARGAITTFVDLIALSNKALIRDTDNYGAELSFLFNESTYGVLHLSAVGDYIRFSELGIEVFYWQADEFKESAEEVLGAICGYLTQNGDICY
ncbi:hypothetical protein OTK49_03285 [Vibrio coralliirubri]|uniref:hypothetical protein n=1 Tax=Vibrio coralliirubri TaxID=1516159 RepID=UPI002283FB84|nr:hypothetical protein [Vibrio coralliirubri]MCY9861540.1 hypothetical protein [Vibrio coralliirubri]